MKQRYGQSSADFARSHGWRVGTVVYGAPLMHHGKQIEASRLLRITAIGEDTVIGRAKITGHDAFDRETSYTFTTREWEYRDEDNPPPCSCEACAPDYQFFRVCPECGNKRCPKATHHDNPCGHSNEPGQPGSSYPARDAPRPDRGPWCNTDAHECEHWFESECSDECKPPAALPGTDKENN